MLSYAELRPEPSSSRLIRASPLASSTHASGPSYRPQFLNSNDPALRESFAAARCWRQQPSPPSSSPAAAPTSSCEVFAVATDQHPGKYFNIRHSCLNGTVPRSLGPTVLQAKQYRNGPSPLWSGAVRLWWTSKPLRLPPRAKLSVRLQDSHVSALSVQTRTARTTALQASDVATVGRETTTLRWAISW